MSRDDADHLDQPLADLLAALDASLANGQTASDVAEPDLSAGQLRLYRLARDSLLRLEQAWPRIESAAAPAGASFDLLTGTGRVGKFQIHRELGRGGSGIVFFATDTVAGRDVALKLPRLEALLDPELRQRFLQEARLTTALDHPGLVTVYETGEIDAVCYIASAYAGDKTLADWLETQLEPVPVRTAAALVAALARGVEHLHEHHILHRDIKPSNVILGTVPEGALPDPELVTAGAPRLTDFGLAKLLDAAAPASTANGTTGGLVLGTAEYMAPEQADGRPELLGRPTDVYALGAVLYEVLTGQPPFRGRNKFDTLRKALAEPPPGLRRLRRDVPRDLEAVCLKCLEKDPRRRYATAGQLAGDLRRYLAGQRPAARATPWWRRAWRWAKRRPVAAALLAIAILAPSAALAVAYSLDRSVSRAQAEELRHTLFTTEAANLAPLIRRLQEHLPTVESDFRRIAADESRPPASRLRAALVVAPAHEPSDRYLRQRILDVSSAELPLVCDALRTRCEECLPGWLARLNDADAEPGTRLRAACALAQLDPNGTYWVKVGGTVADLLAGESPLTVLGWAPLLDPVKAALLPRLKCLHADVTKPTVTRWVASAILGEYCADDPPALVSLVCSADAKQVPLFVDRLRPAKTAVPLLEAALKQVSLARAAEEVDPMSAGRANLALALLRLGHPDPALNYLRMSSDPCTRYHLIHGLGVGSSDSGTTTGDSLKPSWADTAAVVEMLRTAGDDGVRGSLLVVLGGYSFQAIPASLREDLRREILALYVNHPDSGVHSAAAWALGQWGIALPPVAQSFDEAVARESRWYTTHQGHTLAILRPADETFIPAPLRRANDSGSAGSKGSGPALAPARVLPFAIATTEVTVGQYRRSKGAGPHASDDSYPVIDVSFLDAALYCNWLSDQAGLLPCYDVFVGTDPSETKLVATFPDRPGYRLPSEAEWEYACRAGTVTCRFFGESPDYLSGYAWHYSNAEGRRWPVARLRPNPLGLFDIYGNVSEWCVRSWNDLRADHEVTKGGSWRNMAPQHCSNGRTTAHRSMPGDFLGFRVARTLGNGPTSRASQRSLTAPFGEARPLRGFGPAVIGNKASW